MPFELGLAVAWAHLDPLNHTWFLFEAMPYRVQKSLSDLNGTDPHIHNGRVSGVMQGLLNAFDRPQLQPSVPGMLTTHRNVTRLLPSILIDAGAQSPFEARAFQSICYAAKVAAEKSRFG